VDRPIRSPISRNVPFVTPEDLFAALAIVGDWIDDSDDDEPFDGPELSSLLNEIVNRLHVEPRMAAALFRRSLALFAYCGARELSPTLFVDGIPGRVLCLAASRAVVLNRNCFAAGMISPYFDADELQPAYRLALH
jgi:hypothetical protein